MSARLLSNLDTICLLILTSAFSSHIPWFEEFNFSFLSLLLSSCPSPCFPVSSNHLLPFPLTLKRKGVGSMCLVFTVHFTIPSLSIRFQVLQMIPVTRIIYTFRKSWSFFLSVTIWNINLFSSHISSHTTVFPSLSFFIYFEASDAMIKTHNCALKISGRDRLSLLSQTL